ncbi:cytochrome c oxidase assembly protein [Oceanicoccus sagamiensis]|uniref:Cytochrome c oxidase assembly protein CtaG n=1 Tax=Oceanicoccus sagamiensis TaxID=716816 RepID=A0A1X9NJ97_9GAMM|nr:cytochrome c oxidase assembly protein [Oceanicoccus sagamiensis]ARN74063.1 cytochrome c oxidase assembly protein [Oceanicoccus sagamiensis]
MADMPTDNEATGSVAMTVGKLSIVVVVMFAFVFVVMVPLYDVLCDALGINGKTSGERYRVVEATVDTSREIRISFVATNNDGMPWEFRPTDTVLKVNPGAVNDTVFYAKNPLAENMVAQAVPSVSPARAAEYFHKTECFCFNQQPLEGGEETEMPLQFIVDQDLPADIKSITLSYTIFDVTAMVDPKAKVATR